MKKFILILFLTSCSYNNTNLESDNINLNFKSDLSFIEFSELVDKYNNLAKEALSSGDEVLNQNYLQHSDHFSRILVEVNNSRVKNNSTEPSEERKVDTPQENIVSSIEEKK